MVSSGLAVAFEVTGDGCPLAAATSETETSVTCRPPPQLRDDGNVLLRVQAERDGEQLTRQLKEDHRVRYVFMSEQYNNSMIRCLSSEPCILHTLTNAGLLPITVQYTDGVERFSGEVVGRDVLRNVLKVAGDAVGVRVRNITHIESKGDSRPAVDNVEWSLTPAQQDALHTAYTMGYLNVPRETTADAVAAELGVSKSAFLQRLRRAEFSYFDQMFKME